ncbi:oxidoreductase, aldo/keto reductase family [Thioploca ingrica]|uniref:Oxidoreductase, aldo/keto reductase family n=1 Tax=Thioploca ingrica TaxID=40754 RepID=A0A090APK3_9GAMM|nr:oxidoreductase, aldo/keto reductase family [Thioploca ingrica]
MQTRKLGYSNLYLTPIGLGTWAIGGGNNPYGWGIQDDNDSIATIRHALDLGINWIDTAAGYGKGHSEEIVGQAIAGRRHEVIIATKCGILWKEDGSNIYGHLKAESIRQEVENSLRRLKVEVIDLYQIHWPLPDEDIEAGWETVADLVKAGKVRYGGVSNFSVAQLKRIQPIHPVASLQPPYSMLVREVETELLPYCAANDIGVVVYSPMQAGLLTGKMTQERVATFPDNDWRQRSPFFQEPQLSIYLELVEKLRPIAEHNSWSLPQLAIAWVLRRQEVTSAIVGARRPEQIDEFIGTRQWSLSSEDMAKIEALLVNSPV